MYRILSCLLPLALFACQPSPQEEAPAAPPLPALDTLATPSYPLERFESTIQGFERADSANMPEPGGIVFTGSSSIRYWDSLAADMAPLPVLNRGFGGSTMAELLHYAERVILPYDPQLVVVYEGDNDITDSLYTVDEVIQHLAHYDRWMQDHLPGVPSILLAIKPSPSRTHLQEKALEANQRMKAYCAQADHLVFVDIWEPMMASPTRPRGDIFVQDSLHMNRLGYEIWAATVRPVVDSIWASRH